MRKSLRRLDLQAKISLILVGVIVPTFLVMTLAQNQVTQPLLEDELRQAGINSAKTLAAEIVSGRLLFLPNPASAIEDRLQDLLYSQPHILRIDVIARDPVTGSSKVVGTSADDEPVAVSASSPIIEKVTSEFREDEAGNHFWDLQVPIEQRKRDPHGPRKILGAIHMLVSTHLVEKIAGTLWKTTATAAAVSVILLLLVLSYLLRKTLRNDRLLRQAEDQNIQLTEQLHETERQLMNTEKLAVMGQLTASFAHEIGTPLTAIGGHLQLLQEELKPQLSMENDVGERFNIIQGQLSKIEGIVKSFLQNTSKRPSQRQLMDLNSIVDKTLEIVRPRFEAMAVEVRRDFDAQMAPIRAVPLDFEQVLLNLLNNSMDGLRAKAEGEMDDRMGMFIKVSTRTVRRESGRWAEASVYDTGEGIRKGDLKNVLKPFFTTKRPGDGTGLGLPICQQLAHKYGGTLDIDSREGQWTRVTLRIPYE